MANGWTPERKARQAELIRLWKPWKHSTGPKTPRGKAVASRNADKGGRRPFLERVRRMLREQADALESLK